MTNTHEEIRVMRIELSELKQLLLDLREKIHQQYLQEDEILTVNEAAALLKVSKSTLFRYVANRSIPYSRPSGKAKGDLRFSKRALLETIPPKKHKRRGRKTREITVL
ncbi:hypothetical protein DGMP_06380 [Desulfomarina profundi]|uniref:Helix-turn-helix domain-containing protein n=1 Tax=Desulfomarina profundi TaxID=2772557 RepID=A0A8D5JNB7_9BACT|nr:helix-turn-helix domain-containing protein [Desulfomarina profundi]BCL59945.1 hypothetical protein DGMP_06380 [Desulfomarina profundi]